MPSRCIHLALALALAAVVVGAGGAAAADQTLPGLPSIYVTYSPNCTFTMTADGGTTFTSSSPPGPTIPPGVYQIQVLMENPGSGYTCGAPDFKLTGPGVSSETKFPYESILDSHVLPALQPSSTYSADDENAPGATRVYFTTSATGSSSSLVGSAPGPGSGSGKGSTTPDYVGAGILPYRGKLAATVSAAGSAALKLKGKPVVSLVPGRYDVAVADAANKAGFFVERPGGRPVDLTGVRFVGKKTVRYALTKGTWTFFAKASKPIRVTVGA